MQSPTKSCLIKQCDLQISQQPISIFRWESVTMDTTNLRSIYFPCTFLVSFIVQKNYALAYFFSLLYSIFDYEDLHIRSYLHLMYPLKLSPIRQSVSLGNMKNTHPCVDKKHISYFKYLHQYLMQWLVETLNLLSTLCHLMIF